MDWSHIEFDNKQPKSIKRGQRIPRSEGLLHNPKESADLKEKYVSYKGGWSTTWAVHLITILGKALALGPTCINLALFFSVFSSVFDIWSLADTGETNPPRASYLPEIANNPK